MQKRERKRSKACSKKLNKNVKTIAFSEIFLMIMATIAFAFVMGEANVVRAGPSPGQTTDLPVNLDGEGWTKITEKGNNANPNKIWLANKNNGLLFESFDGGTTWTKDPLKLSQTVLVDKSSYQYSSSLLGISSDLLFQINGQTPAQTKSNLQVPGGLLNPQSADKTIVDAPTSAEKETAKKLFDLENNNAELMKRLELTNTNLEDIIKKQKESEQAAKDAKTQQEKDAIAEERKKLENDRKTFEKVQEDAKNEQAKNNEALEKAKKDAENKKAAEASKTAFQKNYEGYKNPSDLNISTLSREEKKKLGIKDIKELAGGVKQIVKNNGDVEEYNSDGALTNTIAGYSGKFLGKQLTGEVGGFTGIGSSFLVGLGEAAVAYGVGYGLGQLFGRSQEQSKALGTGFASGMMMYELTKGGIFGTKAATSASAAGIIGVVVALIVIAATYKNEKQKTYVFTCLPWSAPTRGADCEKCNEENSGVPCSKYRCKSLGQACELLNEDKPGKEMCAWKERNDTISPIISPWKEALTANREGITLQYVSYVNPKNGTRPAERGVNIEQKLPKESKYIPAFTSLQFGINTSEPSVCKIDYNSSKFDEMSWYMEDDNSFSYYHKQRIKLPGIGENATGLILQNNATMQFYIRCRDANENENDDVYAVKFKVDASPDTTPPNIEGTDIVSGSPVPEGIDKTKVDVYVNEPAECKWSLDKKPFKDMENNMSCDSDYAEMNARLTWTCHANLTGIKKGLETTKFYFRCKDQPTANENKRNEMATSYEYSLRGSQKLNIIKVSPNGTITGNTAAVSVDLETETDDGSDEGKATCYFSSDKTSGFVSMFETDSYKHKQTVQLGNGTNTFYFKCTDLALNVATANTTFNVFVDKNAPVIARIYKEEGSIKLVTNENAECTYSTSASKGCNFVFSEGLAAVHTNPSIRTMSYIEWKLGTTYYIKCKDDWGNEPSPNECSRVVRAVDFGSSGTGAE